MRRDNYDCTKYRGAAFRLILREQLAGVDKLMAVKCCVAISQNQQLKQRAQQPIIYQPASW